MILTMKTLLDAHPEASEAELRAAMTLCRCTGYARPLAAVQDYQEQRAGAGVKGIHTETHGS
jgi:aerobic-type carbon monoxide dehydrogenase small subunit (CoxS/CutS family)